MRPGFRGEPNRADNGQSIRQQTYATADKSPTLEQMHTDPTERLQAQAREAQLGLLREEMVEQVMRATSDDVLAAAFRTLEPGSHNYLVHLGKLLNATRSTLPTGSPLHHWGKTGPGRPDVNWRTQCPPCEGSLWGELELLRTLHGNTPAVDPLAELDALRRNAL